MNECHFIVRLVADVDLRFSPTKQIAVVTFTGAINKRNAKKLKEEGRTSANFIRFKGFGKNAENISQYFSKGDLIAITGSYETGMYEKQDGTKVYTNEIFIEKWDFLPNGKKEQQPKPDEDFSFGGAQDFQEIEDDDDVPF